MKNYNKPVAMHHTSSETPTYTETKYSTDQILNQDVEIGSFYGTIKGNPLNLRTETDMGSEPIMTLQPETPIAYEEVDDEWVKVVGYVKHQLVDGPDEWRKALGYVKKKYINLTN